MTTLCTEHSIWPDPTMGECKLCLRAERDGAQVALEAAVHEIKRLEAALDTIAHPNPEDAPFLDYNAAEEIALRALDNNDRGGKA